MVKKLSYEGCTMVVATHLSKQEKKKTILYLFFAGLRFFRCIQALFYQCLGCNLWSFYWQSHLGFPSYIMLDLAYCSCHSLHKLSLLSSYVTQPCCHTLGKLFYCHLVSHSMFYINLNFTFSKGPNHFYGEMFCLKDVHA